LHRFIEWSEFWLLRIRESGQKISALEEHHNEAANALDISFVTRQQLGAVRHH
jgi:hypothetical protein